MDTHILGRTNLKVSVLGFGAAPAAYLQTDRDRAAAVVNQLLDDGVNLIDTAASYPGSEEFLGETVSHRRGQFVLVSKCGMKILESDAPDWSEELILDSVDRSLRLLRTDRIDVMLLHTCDLQTLQKGEAIAALAKAREAGKIRFAGYSGDNEAAAFAARHPEIAVIETSINIVDQVNIDKVLPAAGEHHVGVIAKRPIANAAWKDLSQHPPGYLDYVKPYIDRFTAMNFSAQTIGFRGDNPWPEIALRFTLSFPEVHTAIIGTTNPDNAQHNIELAKKGPLPPSAIEALRTAFRRADPKGEWTGLG